MQSMMRLDLDSAKSHQKQQAMMWQMGFFVKQI